MEREKETHAGDPPKKKTNYLQELMMILEDTVYSSQPAIPDMIKALRRRMEEDYGLERK